MAEEINLKSINEQIRHVQDDVCMLKIDVAQARADTVKVRSEVASVRADVAWLEMKLDAFRESLEERFAAFIERLESSSAMLSGEIKETESVQDNATSSELEPFKWS
jgi:cob(I)alamin adenosyltransferase